jgi:hypothetical protein
MTGREKREGGGFEWGSRRLLLLTARPEEVRLIKKKYTADTGREDERFVNRSVHLRRMHLCLHLQPKIE